MENGGDVAPSFSSRAPAAEESVNEEEEALVALVELRSEEVDRLREQIRRYESQVRRRSSFLFCPIRRGCLVIRLSVFQLEVAVTKLEDARSKLSRLRSNAVCSSSFLPLLPKAKDRQTPSQRSHSRPPLVIPAVKPLTVPLVIPVVKPLPVPQTSAAATSVPARAALPAKHRAADAQSPKRGKAVKISKRKPGMQHLRLSRNLKDSTWDRWLNWQIGNTGTWHQLWGNPRRQFPSPLNLERSYRVSTRGSCGVSSWTTLITNFLRPGSQLLVVCSHFCLNLFLINSAAHWMVSWTCGASSPLELQLHWLVPRIASRLFSEDGQKTLPGILRVTASSRLTLQMITITRFQSSVSILPR